MQSQLLASKTSTLFVIACGIGLLLGIASVWMPPYFVLIGAVGIVYVVIAWRWTEIAILCTLLFTSTIFNIYEFPSIPIGIGNLIISDILLFVLLGIFLLRSTIKSSSYFINTPLDFPLLAFYVVALLSTIIGVYKLRTTFNDSLEEVRTLSSYLMFYVVTNLVRDKKQLRRLYGGIVFLAIFVAIMMIVQYLLGGAVQILPGRVETLTTAASTSYGVTRVLPPGQSLVMIGFVCLVVQALFDKSSPRLAIYLIQFGLVGLAVLLTFNRSFWAAIFLALLLAGFFVSLRDKVRYAQIAFWTILVVLLVLAPFQAVKGGEVAKLIDGIVVRASTLINFDTTREGSVVYRYVENEYAYPQIASHPLIGLGLGAYYRPADRRIDYGLITGSSYIHNGHLFILLKTGLVGYLFFMWFMLLFIKRGFQNWKLISDPLFKGIVLSFTAVIVGIQVAAIVNPVFMMTYWSPAIGIMLGMSESIIRINNDHSVGLH
jgi:O-antigen ligase